MRRKVSWRFLRDRCGADFVVAEVKNTVARAGKEEVLQLANYLTRYGTGLVDVLLTRAGIDSTAQWVSREQWVLHDKLIICLSDDDIKQMLLSSKQEAIHQSSFSNALKTSGCGSRPSSFMTF
jgi:hypothetical protein